MKPFRFFKKKENDTFELTEPDRRWVEENLLWIISVLGKSNLAIDQFLLNEKYFPLTFKSDIVLIENIIKDLCSLFQMDEEKITFEISSDFRDVYGLPYQIEGKPFETELEIREGKYNIHVANSLRNQRLIYQLTQEFIRIKLIENKFPVDKEKNSNLLIYLAGIYFGFGVLLSQNLIDHGKINDGFWETKWNYISAMPIEVMAYALALYSTVLEEKSPSWKENLPNEIKIHFEKAMNFLIHNPSQSYEIKQIESKVLLKVASQLYVKGDVEAAITQLKKIITLTNDDGLKATVFNNLGYYSIRLKHFEQAVIYFKNALTIHPNHGYANDNLGYTFIQLGKLEEGRGFLEKALKTENNDRAYSNRNFALYYQAKGDMNTAAEYFKKSFEVKTNTVDLLEYHFANFLISQGEKEKGMEFLKVAVDKGEPEAIERMNELINQSSK